MHKAAFLSRLSLLLIRRLLLTIDLRVRTNIRASLMGRVYDMGVLQQEPHNGRDVTQDRTMVSDGLSYQKGSIHNGGTATVLSR